MRQRTRETAQAFLNHTKKSSGNCSSTGEDYLLHGHCIAWWNYGKEKPEIHFNLRGWPTVTTRDRINGILDLLGSKYRVCQVNFTQFLTSPGHSLIPVPDDGTFMIPNN